MTISSLFLAARDGDEATLTSLIASGEDANRGPPAAARRREPRGSPGTVQLLRTAPRSTPSASGTTSLMLACLEGHVAEKLLEAGAQPSDHPRWAHRFLAAGQRAVASSPQSCCAPVPTPRRRGRGSTALQYAAQHGATDTIESLLGAGAAVDAARADGRTALLAACQNGHAAADPAARGGRRRTPRGEHTALHLRATVRRCRRGSARARPAKARRQSRLWPAAHAARAGGATRRHRGRGAPGRRRRRRRRRGD